VDSVASLEVSLFFFPRSQFQDAVVSKRKELSALEMENPSGLWVKDLDHFLEHWNKVSHE
jgi:hypothetical protein